MKSPALLVTKFQPPASRSDGFSRSRLLHRLDNPKSGRITLVLAPAGYGKTTLLDEWASHSKHKIGWISLDAADNDPVLFWRYVAAALSVKLAARVLANATEILNWMARSAERTTLILDNLDALDSTILLRELAFFIEHAGPKLTFVLVSRAEPSLPLARWRARGWLNEIHTQQLAFTRSEVETYLLRTRQLELDAETVKQLEEFSEGWPVGLELAALTMQEGDALPNLDTARAYIFEYFASEVLERQNGKTRQFLLETSVLDTFDAALVDAINGRSEGEKLLLRIARANLFLFGSGWIAPSYRFHRLFAAFLRAQLHASDPARERQLHRRAARYLWREGHAEKAIQHALQADDLKSAADWIDRTSEQAMQHGQLETILNWLDALPEQLVKSRPSLNLWYGWVLCLQRRYEEMEVHLRAAELSIRRAARSGQVEKSEARTVRGKSAAVRTLAAVLQNQDANALKWSQRALDLLPERIRNERSVVWLNRAQALERLGRDNEASDAYEMAVRQSRAAKHPFIHLEAVLALSNLLCRRDENCQAAQALKQAVAFLRALKADVLAESAHESLRQVESEIARSSQKHQFDLLTTKEREILKWLAEGESNPQIAKHMHIGVGTVNWHTKNIYRKLNVRNRTEAAAYAHSRKSA